MTRKSKYYCQFCNIGCVSSQAYEKHLKTNKHAKNLAASQEEESSEQSEKQVISKHSDKSDFKSSDEKDKTQDIKKDKNEDAISVSNTESSESKRCEEIDEFDDTHVFRPNNMTDDMINEELKEKINKEDIPSEPVTNIHKERNYYKERVKILNRKVYQMQCDIDDLQAQLNMTRFINKKHKKRTEKIYESIRDNSDLYSFMKPDDVIKLSYSSYMDKIKIDMRYAPDSIVELRTLNYIDLMEDIFSDLMEQMMQEPEKYHEYKRRKANIEGILNEMEALRKNIVVKKYEIVTEEDEEDSA